MPGDLWLHRVECWPMRSPSFKNSAHSAVSRVMAVLSPRLCNQSLKELLRLRPRTSINTTWIIVSVALTNEDISAWSRLDSPMNTWFFIECFSRVGKWFHYIHYNAGLLAIAYTALLLMLFGTDALSYCDVPHELRPLEVSRLKPLDKPL